HWSALPERTISTRPISTSRRKTIPDRHDLSIQARTVALPQRSGRSAMGGGLRSVHQDLFFRQTNRQALGNVLLLNWWIFIRRMRPLSGHIVISLPRIS